MKVTASVKSGFNQHEVLVSTNEKSQPLQIQCKSSGYGSGMNGGELLMLALATCFCNDLYREAEKRGIKISSLEVIASGEFNKEGEAGRNLTYSAKVEADCSNETIEDLIRHTDTVAEIHNTLRSGLSVTLVQ